VTALVDTSALIEYLRGTQSPTAVRVRALSELSNELVITDVVEMEILAGARDRRHLEQLEAFLSAFGRLPISGLEDFVHAAALFRECRSRGVTVRHLTDCLVAAIAIRNDVPVMHHDRDFDVLARHTPLRIA
jgi:predicted nucleic acid-binding protein